MNGLLHLWNLLLYKVICLLIGKNYFYAMASQCLETVENVETEELSLSDEDLQASQNYESIPLNIDCNSRVVLSESTFEYRQNDDCDVRLRNRAKNIPGKDDLCHTSSEELEVSDDEPPSYERLTLNTVNLDSIASVMQKLGVDSFSALNYSTTLFDKRCSTDAEYVSDDECDTSQVGIIDGKTCRKFASGISVGGISCVEKPGIPFSNKHPARSGETLSFKRLINENTLIDVCEDTASPLMTCLEFIKSECSDEGETDVEDISGRSNSEGEMNVDNPLDLNQGNKNSVGNRDKGGLNADFLLPPDARRSSVADMSTEDEALSFENDCSKLVRRKTKRRNRHLEFDKDDYSSGSLTDEDVINIPNQEWTEADENGGMRQITQIKTETSIKLEGDGDGATSEGDDLVSRTTATTTTRIVTTVTTDQDGESHSDQQVTEDGDDLRHSVEVILNQFMSDDGKSEEHDE